MKWLFLVNNIDLMMEFLGKLEAEVVQNGDESVLVFNSKMAEYRKRNFFSKDAKVVSKIDWLIKNYKKDYMDFGGISWKEFFPTFERKANFLNLNYNSSFEIVSQLYQFLDFVFKSEKPDVVINEAPANVFTNIAYHLCRKYKITYFGVVGSKFSGRVDVYDSPHTLSLYKKTFDDLDKKSISVQEKQFASAFAKDFVSHKKLPPYMDFQYSFSDIGVGRYARRIIKLMPYFVKYLSLRKEFKNFDYESESYLNYNLKRSFYSLTRNLRAFYFNKKYSGIDDGNKFFVYPLHFHPEASTLVLATYFADQLNTIKNIAFSLPFPYKLYVKEHPIAIGTRTSSFYKEIKKLPNVVLIDSKENNKELINKSAGVITLTSTVGMEAAILGKPVYVLGDVFYDYHPFVREVGGFEELRNRISADLIKDKKIENLNGINCRFVTSYFINTIPGDVIEALKGDDSNNYRNIYKSIKKIYEQI